MELKISYLYANMPFEFHRIRLKTTTKKHNKMVKIFIYEFKKLTN